MSENLIQHIRSIGGADSFFIADVIARLLSKPENPSQDAVEITQELRDLSGAKTVILVQFLKDYGGEGHSIVAVSPERRCKWCKSDEVSQLIQIAYDLKKTTLLSETAAEHSVGKRILSSLCSGDTLVTPLQVGTKQVGCLILFDLPEESTNRPILIMTLEMMATVIALILRNSLLFERQENMILDRTCELEKTNKSLQLEIIEREAAEKALRKSEVKVRTLLNSIGDAVIATDIKGLIIQMNPVAQEITGWKFEESIGRPLSEIFNIVNAETRVKVENPVEKVLSTGEIIGLASHILLISRYGSEYQIADSGAPIKDENGEITGVVLVFRDVTNEYRMQEELQKIQKLESIGILAGGIAHDFNNILMGLFGNISLAKEEISTDNPGFKHLENAEKSMNRAISLTKQLLTFAKGGDPVKENIVIGNFAEEVICFDLSGSNIIPVFDLAEDLWFCNVDKGQLQQVFSNLTINANQAMPDGGRIYISIENIVIEDNLITNIKPGKFIKVTFRDEGIGIPRKYIDRIFDPYFSTKQSGSGLGLATTYSIIRKHRGQIQVESNPELGTCFTIFFPASEPQPASGNVKVQEQKDIVKYKGRILVMDDEEMIQTLLKIMLEKFGFDVELTSDGNQAIDIYCKALEVGDRFDIVIMDLTIPGGLGGKDAAKDLLQIDPDAKIIVSSGYANDPVMSNYTEFGFKGIVTKPFTKDQLIEAINKVM